MNVICKCGFKYNNKIDFIINKEDKKDLEKFLQERL